MRRPNIAARSMRIYTCTPVDFGPGDAGFFSRDSGLLCRGLQALGIESRSVMPGLTQAHDDKDLLRTDYTDLESANWWQSLGLDAVVLYAWGRPRFRKLASAIRKAGIFLILNQDSGGLVSPLVGWRDWLDAQWIYGGQGLNAHAWQRFAYLAARGLTVGLWITDPLRAWHLKQGDVIACVSPIAAERYRKLCRVYGGELLADKVQVIAHAVETYFRYSGMKKRRQVACVGRWHGCDEVQKRSALLMRVIAKLLSADPVVTVVIAGRFSNEMASWHSSLDETQQDRVRLTGRLNREALADLFDESQVFYSPSAYESFGIAAAEALCSGCSVVAERKITMPSFQWFVSENSGTLAERDDADDHASTLIDELNEWSLEKRNAARISITWCERLHADQVAAKMVDMIR